MTKHHSQIAKCREAVDITRAVPLLLAVYSFSASDRLAAQVAKAIATLLDAADVRASAVFKVRVHITYGARVRCAEVHIYLVYTGMSMCITGGYCIFILCIKIYRNAHVYNWLLLY